MQLQDVLARCWSQDPVHRPDFGYIIRALNEALEDTPSLTEAAQLGDLDQVNLICSTVDLNSLKFKEEVSISSLPCSTH